MPDHRERLAAEASAAAVRAGVEVRALGAEEMAGASDLFDRVWRAEGAASPMEPGLLVALAHAGGYVCGAYAGGRLVGACAGFFGTPLGEVLHSHIAAVAPGTGGAGIGTAMKRHQRAWCAGRGLRTIAWTFDPLIARNAWFNLGLLGAHPVEYLVDFYGDMRDGLNAGQGSDRLLVHWPVQPEPGAEPGAVEQPEGDPAVALAVGPDEEPVVSRVDGHATAATLAVPRDIETLRAADPALGTRWRHAFRDTYLTLHADGRRLAAFVRPGRVGSGHYRMERT